MKVNSGKDVAEEYTSSLADLTINSKPLINMLTMLAEDYIEHAPLIVKVVELHLQKVTCDIKLPILYLIDSIVKNVGKTYVPLFTQNIVSTFCAVFEKVDEKVRFQMFKLRQTWNEVFPQKKLLALDVRVHAIDPAWPITATQSVNIHVNPKFLQAHASTSTVSEVAQPINDGIMREELLKQQKELLELQKRKVELELMQTKAILEEQQKKLENQTAGLISEPVTSSQANAVGGQQLQVNALQFSKAENTTNTHTAPMLVANTRTKPYKSGGSSFRSRDPRMKFNKEKYTESKAKGHPQKDPNTKERKQHKKEKKTIKKHKERQNVKNTSNKNEWNRVAPAEVNVSLKKPMDRYDKDLFTKLPAEEPPPPGVDVITCSDVNVQPDVEKKDDGQGFTNQATSTMHTPTPMIINSDFSPARDSPIDSSNKNENSLDDIEMEVCESKVSDIERKGGGIKRCHAESSVSVKEPLQVAEVQQSSTAQPNQIKSPTLELPPSPTISNKELDVINPSIELASNAGLDLANATKDVDFRLLPFPSENDSEDTDSQIPIKKSRAEVLDALFGVEDVDLRRFPPLVQSPQQAIFNSTEDSNPLPSSCSPVTDNALAAESSANPLFLRESLQHNLTPSPPINVPVSTFSNLSPRNNVTSPHTEVSSHSSATLSTSPDLNSPAAPVVTSQLFQNNINSLPEKTKHLPIPSAFQDDNSQNFNRDTPKVAVSLPSSVCPSHILDTSSPPPAPPPPIISKSDTFEESSWANYKKVKSEENGCGQTFEGFRRTGKGKKERTHSSLFRSSNGLVEEIKESEQECEERSSANCNLIIKEAEQQLSSGNITFSQYNRMLKEVIAINEARKLQEALRKDENNEMADDSEVEMLENDDEVGSYSKKSKLEPEFNGPLTPETGSTLTDSADVIDNESSKSEEYQFPKDGRSKRHYSSEGQSRTFNSESYSQRFPAHPPVWDNRNSLQQNQSQIAASQRPSWYMRGAATQQIGPQEAKQLPPRNTPTNFPLWAVPPAPNCNPQVFYETNKNSNYRYGCNVPYKKSFIPPIRPPHTRRQDVPPSDIQVLELIEKDTMRPIRIDGIVREVRFYGETAVIILSWDDPREVMFQQGSRRLIVDEHEQFILHFNSPYRDCIIDGQIFKIRLGAPTRELFVDGLYYEMIFGGPPVQIMLGGQRKMVQLSGPMPKLRIGEVPRTDLVAGKINLIIDAKKMFPIYLDAKPQRFEIGGVPYILRFVEALQTVVINGVPFKFEFGGVPVPIFFHGEKHFLRLSVLPRDIRPGYVNIVNMEGGRLPSPPPELAVPAVSPPAVRPGNSFNQDINNYNVLPAENSLELQPLELLTSLMPATMAPLVGHNYAIEQASNNQTTVDPPPVPSNALQSLGDINVGELFQKLVASGIVPPVSKKETSSTEDDNVVKLVDFSKPETLKVKQPGLVARLYSGIQCSSCGVRFPPEQTVKYSQHLDWHFRQNRREKMSARIAQSRRWNYDVSDWIQYQEIEDVDDRAASWFEIQEKKSNEKVDDSMNEPSVVAGEGAEEATCRICHDNFDQFYNEEKEEWHFKKAIRVDGILYHPLCYEDLLENRARVDPPEPTVLEEEELIVIDDGATLDDNTTVISDNLEEDPVSKENEDKKSLPEENSTNASDNDIEIVPISPEPSDTKSPEDENIIKEAENCDKPIDEDSDDDILQIEVVERHIESYDIIDDEDDENDINKSNQVSTSNNTNDQTKILDIPSDDDEDIVDFSKIKVKTEKIDISELVSVPNHLTVVSSIDGNVELQDAAPVVLPKNKIKINISSKHIQQSKPVTNEPVLEPNHATIEPPPPGEELFPANLKPRLVGQKMVIREPVYKGTDTSGLCTIM
ncbi:uncharacterized protein [Rhodnius prolixus]|uniref:uncharacterized protein n=1 Tax=Rhodnius prolixus TaxID=13249 RepID=UPI003D18974E